MGWIRLGLPDSENPLVLDQVLLVRPGQQDRSPACVGLLDLKAADCLPTGLAWPDPAGPP